MTLTEHSSRTSGAMDSLLKLKAYGLLFTPEKIFLPINVTGSISLQVLMMNRMESLVISSQLNK
jgi:hypothetical protein